MFEVLRYVTGVAKGWANRVGSEAMLRRIGAPRSGWKSCWVHLTEGGMRGASLMLIDPSRRTSVGRDTLRMVMTCVMLGELGHRDRGCVLM